MWPIELVFIINISLSSIDNKRSASMKVFLFLNKQHGRMAQRLARLPPKPKIATSNPSSILSFILMFLNYYHRYQNMLRQI